MSIGIFAILDDISMLMDDTAVMAKVAAKKTVAVLGDDLAVGAEKASGFHASRELPVIWAISKGSIINKLIILPLAFVLSYYASWLIVPILILGGTYLTYEGAEKIIETFFIKNHHEEKVETTEISEQESFKQEKEKINKAIKTDFILSIEIIMIALGTVINKSLVNQVIVVSLIGVLATIGVYGLVALMVRLDDMGYKLIQISEKTKGISKKSLNILGKTLVATLPKLIKLLAVVGTIAMILVGGGMYVHNIHEIHELISFMPEIISDFIIGLCVGFIAYSVMELYVKLKTIFSHQQRD